MTTQREKATCRYFRRYVRMGLLGTGGGTFPIIVIGSLISLTRIGTWIIDPKAHVLEAFSNGHLVYGILISIA